MDTALLVARLLLSLVFFVAGGDQARRYRPAPVGAADEESQLPAQPRRDQLLYDRVDRRILPTNPLPSQEPEKG